MNPLVLASASPRRAELLRSAGIPFDVVVADIDETILAGEGPEDFVRRVAEAKARAAGERAPGRFVLAADTVVVVEGDILGKPKDTEDAARMLRLLSDRAHRVMTGVVLVLPASADLREDVPHRAGVRAAVVVTTVEFARLTDAEIYRYVASGEPMDKAGAYAIQGLASRFVTRVDGSYTNVVGLPLALVYAMCREAGIQVS